MQTQLFTNNATAALSTDLTAGSTTVLVATGEGALFASPTGGQFQLGTLTDDNGQMEIVAITARTADSLTVTRAQEGTGALTFSVADNARISGRLTKGTMESLPQFDFGGNPHGADSVNLQPSRAAATAVASGADAIAIGSDTTASGNTAIAVGDGSTASFAGGIAVGDAAQSTQINAIAVGTGAAASTVDSIAVGTAAAASGTNGIAIGDTAVASQTGAIAVGLNATCAIPGAAVFNGAFMVQKDTGQTDFFREFVAPEITIMSDEIELDVAADWAADITLPSGVKFFPNEVGVIITVEDTVTVDPAISFGTGADEVALLASSTVTETVVGERTRYTTLLDYDGITSLSGSVKTAATATDLKGRFYWKGILVENE